MRVSGRSTVGVAFGGGSARGIAHVGIIRWLEEHRVPIDMAAGTSMGGLVGGAFATGMDARELEDFIDSLDWDQLFGASSFAHKNIRRKADARAYPSRLEFGLKGGIVPPAALNDGEYVELLLGRVAAPYFGVEDFDDLPTPFRTVAVDLLSAQLVVLRQGSLADAMRATMSLPLIFPPVELNGQVLIDGGTMNNVPADIVKAMGADRVVAVNVGDLSDREGVTYTMFGIAGDTLDAMMRASTRRALAAADVVINVPLHEYGSLDWRRAGALIEEGYRAAESMRDQLLPLAISEGDYDTWRRARQARRRTDLPAPTFVQLEGFATDDAKRLNVLLAPLVGAPLDPAAVERDIAVIMGLDRYQTVTWRLRYDAARGLGLLVQGRVKPYAPPFMMLGINLENMTSTDFRFTATARYLAFDTVGSGSELRVDGTVGSDPSLGIELYRPIGPTPLFVAPYAGVGRMTFDLIDDDAVVARYKAEAGADRPERRCEPGRAQRCAHRCVRRGYDRVHRGRGPWLPRTAGEGDGRRSCLAAGYAGQSGGPSWWRAVARATHSHLQRSRPRGTRRDARRRHGPDSAVCRRESLLEHRSTESRLPVRRGRHILRFGTIADQSVLTRYAVPARRLRHRRAQGGSLLRCDRWIPQARWPAA